MCRRKALTTPIGQPPQDFRRPPRKASSATHSMFLIMFIPQLKPDLRYFSSQKARSITSDERWTKATHNESPLPSYCMETSKLFVTKPAIAGGQGLEIWGRQTHCDSDVNSTNSRKLHGTCELSVNTWLSDNCAVLVVNPTYIALNHSEVVILPIIFHAWISLLWLTISYTQDD